MKRLILLRHGITEANLNHRYCGSTDLPLAEGPLAEFLSRREGLVYPEPTGLELVTSGMRRTEETLRVIYGALPHRQDAAFREIDFGVFENRSYEELKDRADYQAWLTGDNEKNVCPGGESGEQMTARVLEGLGRLTSDTLLVTHGGVIAAIMEQLFPDTGRSRYRWQPQPYTGYEIRFSETGEPTFRTIPESR